MKTIQLNLDNYISTSSLHKEMKPMRDFYKVPTKYNKTAGGYYYDEISSIAKACPVDL